MLLNNDYFILQGSSGKIKDSKKENEEWVSGHIFQVGFSELKTFIQK